MMKIILIWKNFLKVVLKNNFFNQLFLKMYLYVKVRDRAKAAVEKSTEALSKSNIVSRQIMDISTLIESELRVKLLAMQNNRHAGLGNIPKLSNSHFFTIRWIFPQLNIVDFVLVEETRRNVKHVDTKMTYFTKKSFEFRSINATVALKLDELRKKIMRAKQAASSVSLSCYCS